MSKLPPRFIGINERIEQLLAILRRIAPKPRTKKTKQVEETDVCL